MSTQIVWPLILAVPVASIARTVTHEEVSREPRDFCKARGESAAGLWQRKFFYLFTCEYCFSHYTAAAVLFLTRFKLLYPDWCGYVVSFSGLIWVSNVYMAGFANLRLDVPNERGEIKSKSLDVKAKAEELKVDGVA